jgi:hypothetical protein
VAHLLSKKHGLHPDPGIDQAKTTRFHSIPKTAVRSIEEQHAWVRLLKRLCLATQLQKKDHSIFSHLLTDQDHRGHRVMGRV